jgi:osmotically-inducible protein OsmY
MNNVKTFLVLSFALLLSSCVSVPLIITTAQSFSTINTLKDIAKLPEKRQSISGAIRDKFSDIKVGSLIKTVTGVDNSYDVEYIIYKKTIILGGTVRTAIIRDKISEIIKHDGRFNHIENAITVGEVQSLIDYVKNKVIKKKIRNKIPAKINDNMVLAYYNENIYVLGELTKAELDVVLNICVKSTSINGIKYFVSDGNLPGSIIDHNNYRRFEFQKSL